MLGVTGHLTQIHSLSVSSIVISVMFRVMLTLALAVVSRRERDSVSSYPSPVVRVSSAHRVELADSTRGTGGWKSTPSVDIRWVKWRDVGENRVKLKWVYTYNICVARSSCIRQVSKSQELKSQR